ncbi:MAG TPA: hypothetical protein VD969_21865 [Symbiobacteriaceae bacterium]|nr:hypothetical protein [Symbiobacteriaceae bacterium]
MRAGFVIALSAIALLLSTGCAKEEAPPAAAKPMEAAPTTALTAVSNVPRDKPFTFPLPEGLTADQIEGVAVLQGNEFVAVGAELKDRQVIIAPASAYERNGTYTLRLFAAGGKRYEGSFTTESYVRVEPGRIQDVAANPAKGFHFDYYLYVPPGVKPGGAYRFLIAPNDSRGALSDSAEYHAGFAWNLVQPSTQARLVADALNLIVLAPAVPYPTSPAGLYLQTLSRATLQVKQAPFVRVDEQVIAMVDDARQMLAQSDIQTEKQVFVSGTAAAGLFADRFALLHPDLVAAVACGGTSGMITLPLADYQGRTLRYPIGIADLQEVGGIAFRPEAYRQVARFVYLSEKDTKDFMRDGHAFEQQDADLISAVLGAQLQPDRWRKTQQIALEMELPIRFATYPDAPDVADLIDFFRVRMNENGGTAK